jgi:TonB-linked SusC/RagA family outer membrane protein
MSSFLVAQRSITGRVQDDQGQPLVGATVLVEGTVRGIYTDDRGRFALKLEPEDEALKVLYVGFQDTVVAIAGQAFLQIAMSAKVSTTEEVVVIGYGTKNKKEALGAVAVIDAADLEGLPTLTAGSALQGRVAGVFVQSPGGSPGAEPSILIRGKSSISASNDPLVIIDGIQGTVSQLNNLNFNDIKSFNVLKDAASSAIYGTAGANGVIIIETKRGAAGETRFNFEAYQGFQTNPRRLELLGSADALDLIREQAAIRGSDLSQVLGSEYVSGVSIDTSNLAAVDWQDEIFQLSSVQRYTLSASGGNEQTQFRVSGSYFAHEGVIKNSFFNRLNIWTNFDHKITDRIKLQGDFGFSRRNSRGAPTGGTIFNSATLATISTYSLIPTWDPAYAEGERYFINPFQPEVNVPLANLYSGVQSGNSNLLNTKLGVSWEILEGLEYRLNVIGKFGFGKSWNYSSKFNTDDGRRGNGSGASASNQSIRRDIENLLSYRKTKGEHSLNLLYGYITQRQRNENTRVSLGQYTLYPGDSLYHAYAAQVSRASAGLGFGVNRNSHIARIDYSYGGRYYLLANLRVDGSSNFGPENKFGAFPSFSAGWRISEEPFMKRLEKTISALKIRYGFGVTGNDAIPPFQYALFFGSGVGGSVQYPIFGAVDMNQNLGDDIVTGLRPDLATLYNPAIRWETTAEHNIGLESEFFGGRLGFEGDFYTKRSFDLLYEVSLPLTSPGNTGFVNIGELRGWGFELKLSSRNIVRKHAFWLTELTFTRDQNQVVSLGDVRGLQLATNGINAIIPGQPVNVMWGYESEGVITDEETLAGMTFVLPDGSVVYGQNSQTALGDLRFRNTNGPELDAAGNPILDANGNPVERITEDDRGIIGNPNPDFYFGLNNSLTLGNFDLTIFLQGAYGIDIFNQTQRTGENYLVWQNQLATVLDRYPMGTEVPRVDPLERNANSRISTRYVEDGSYLRLKNVGLGYTFAPALLQRLRLQGLRLYVSGENLWTGTNFTGWDPEMVGASGIENGGYPQPRTFTMGLNVGF